MMHVLVSLFGMWCFYDLFLKPGIESKAELEMLRERVSELEDEE